MYAQVSHPYLIQAVALWCSFLPAFGIVALIAGARLESRRRRARGRELTRNAVSLRAATMRRATPESTQRRQCTQRSAA